MPQQEAFRFNVKIPLGHFLYPLPVPFLHRLVQHSLKEGTGLVEVINLLLEVVECLPFFQSFGKLTTSDVAKKYDTQSHNVMSQHEHVGIQRILYSADSMDAS